MPLKKGSSRKVISKNISELEGSRTKAGRGRSRKQNVAIALNKARKSGGGSPNRGNGPRGRKGR